MKNKLRNIKNSLRLILWLEGILNIENWGNDIKTLFEEIVKFFGVEDVSYKFEKLY